MRTRLTVALLALALTGCARATAPLPAEDLRTPADAGPEVATLVSAVNAHRDSLGLPALLWMPVAARVAREHCDDMRRRSYFSHVTPDGLDLAARLAAAGIAFWSAGENLAAGEPDGHSALAGWLASPEHRATLESPEYTHHGVAMVDGLWTHEFLLPREAATLSARQDPQRHEVGR